MSKKNLIVAALAMLIAMPSLAADSARYEIEVLLHRITVIKVVEAPGDTQEELFGRIDVSVGPRSDVLWNVPKERPLELGQGQSRSFFESVRSAVISRVSVENTTIIASGLMNDSELFATIRYKPCSQCGLGGGREIRMRSLMDQIDAIPAGRSKFLRFGRDDTFQLDWFEGDANSSHVRALFKVRVTRIR